MANIGDISTSPKFLNNGANCFATALSYAGFGNLNCTVHDKELEFYLDSSLCRKLLPGEVKEKFDIGTITNNMGSYIHAFVWWEDGYVLTKNGYSKTEPLHITKESNVTSIPEYSGHLDYYRCNGDLMLSIDSNNLDYAFKLSSGFCSDHTQFTDQEITQKIWQEKLKTNVQSIKQILISLDGKDLNEDDRFIMDALRKRVLSYDFHLSHSADFSGSFRTQKFLISDLLELFCEIDRKYCHQDMFR